MKKELIGLLCSFAIVVVMLMSVAVFASTDTRIFVESATQLISAIQSAKESDNIVLTENIDIDTAIEITSTVIINLNGKTLTALNDTEGNGIFWVKEGGNLTINGNGTINSASQANDYSMAIWATNGGIVTINGGTFTNLDAKAFEDNGTTPNNNELIYASRGGQIIINDGTFIGNYNNTKYGTRYTLNQKDEDLKQKKSKKEQSL